MLIAVKLLVYFCIFMPLLILLLLLGQGQRVQWGEADIVATLPPAIRRFDTPRFDIDTSG